MVESTDVLLDSFGRRIDYLRISVTNLCNFRCVYCSPSRDIPECFSSYLLTRREILRFVQIASKLGVCRIRLTGGEPLLRKDILDIVADLKSVEGIQDLSMTTNGSRLIELLNPLKQAGLDRINISLDSMDPNRFKTITLSTAYSRVFQSVFAALKAGFPVKLNMVALKGLSEQEIVDFTRLAFDYPLHVRFLEFMPLCGEGWQSGLVIPFENIRKVVENHFQLKLIARENNPAQTFKVLNGKGFVGFIAPLTESFCDNCSRMRLLSDGSIQPCLFSNERVSVRDLLRRNRPEDEIRNAIRQAVQIKPKGNWFHDRPFHENEEYSYLDQRLRNGPLIRNIGG